MAIAIPDGGNAPACRQTATPIITPETCTMRAHRQVDAGKVTMTKSLADRHDDEDGAGHQDRGQVGNQSGSAGEARPSTTMMASSASTMAQSSKAPDRANRTSCPHRKTGSRYAESRRFAKVFRVIGVA